MNKQAQKVVYLVQGYAHGTGKTKIWTLIVWLRSPHSQSQK